MRIQWKKTSVGGYMTQEFGGWWTGETDAIINPGDNDQEWLLALRLNGRYEYAVYKTIAQAKRVAAQKIREVL